MKKLLLFCGSWMLMVRVVSAAEYVIDFGVITDLEQLRPLIDLCTDFGSLERNRSALESVGDLESLREFLERIGGCAVQWVSQNPHLSGTETSSIMCSAIRRALLVLVVAIVSPSNILVERDAPQAGFVGSLRAHHRQRYVLGIDR